MLLEGAAGIAGQRREGLAQAERRAVQPLERELEGPGRPGGVRQQARAVVQRGVVVAGEAPERELPEVQPALVGVGGPGARVLGRAEVEDHQRNGGERPGHPQQRAGRARACRRPAADRQAQRHQRLDQRQPLRPDIDPEGGQQRQHDRQHMQRPRQRQRRAPARRPRIQPAEQVEREEHRRDIGQRGQPRRQLDAVALGLVGAAERGPQQRRVEQEIPEPDREGQHRHQADGQRGAVRADAQRARRAGTRLQLRAQRAAQRQRRQQQAAEHQPAQVEHLHATDRQRRMAHLAGPGDQEHQRQQEAAGDARRRAPPRHRCDAGGPHRARPGRQHASTVPDSSSTSRSAPSRAQP